MTTTLDREGQPWNPLAVTLTQEAIIAIVPVIYHFGEDTESEAQVKYYVGVKPAGLFKDGAYREDILYTFLRSILTHSFPSLVLARQYAENLAYNTGRVIEMMPTEVI